MRSLCPIHLVSRFQASTQLTYLFIVDGWDSGDQGSYSLHLESVTPSPPPPAPPSPPRPPPPPLYCLPPSIGSLLTIDLAGLRFNIEYERRVTKLNATTNSTLAVFNYEDSADDDDVSASSFVKC